MIATLATRRLGTTDLQLSTVGFGASAAGGGGWAYGWGPQDDAASIASIRRAVELGANWIDTAAVYGLGHSEMVVRQALDGMAPGDRSFVFTKCGPIWDDSAWNGSTFTSFIGRIRPALRSRTAGKRWRRWTMRERSGRSAFSNFDVGLLQRCQAVRHVDSLQPSFSLIRRQAAESD
jgi:aryl-alcohol dehydrogenase-like predicted oxidoreductase